MPRGGVEVMPQNKEGLDCRDMLQYEHVSSDNDSQFSDELALYNEDPLTSQVAKNMSLVVGTRFDDAMSFKHFIRSKAIHENFGVKIKASDKTRVIATCAYVGCPWRVRASLCVDGQTFEVRKVENLHVCPGVNRAGNKQATSKWVAEQIQDIVKKHPDIPPKQINEELESKYGLSLPYMKLWRSRELARDTLFGPVDDSYKWVPTLREELIRRNPGSHITYEYDIIDNSFRRFYVCFKVCIDGFLVGCRHLIGLDACHLKSKYLGVLLSANSLDGNNGLYTIAFAVVESESKSSWQWFLKNLVDSFGCEVVPLSFISDMEKGLGEAIKFVFPNAEHRVCIRHLWKNMKRYHHFQDSQKIRNIFWLAANAYTRHEYETKFIELCKVSPQVYSYLLNLPYKWSRAQFLPEIKNHYNTNNLSESFNSWIGVARDKPIVELVDMVRGMVMEQRAERKINASSWRGELVPAIEDYMREITTRKEYFIIRQSTSNTAEVEGHSERHEVNIELKQCSCRYWQMTGLPCIHVVAFIGSKGNPLWHTYVDQYYHVNRYAMAYDGAISTLPGKSQWRKCNDDIEIGAPNTLRPRGRPRKRRIKSFMENNTKKIQRLHKCSRCGCWGHHRNTCKNALDGSNSKMPDVDINAYSSELSYADLGSREKLPVKRGQHNDEVEAID